MAVDTKKNKDALVKAYEQVQNNSDETDWALYGYEGQTSVLKLVGTGDGGIEELSEDLSSGKMMFGYCRVVDPNSALPKYVLIHWTGESVPENLKLKYTAHLRDVQAFLKTIHVVVPARCDDDIDVDAIMKKVAKSSGANYGFHKEKPKPKDHIPTAVGSNYQRVMPQKEIDINNRDKFWAQAEKEEIIRQREEKEKAEQEKKKMEEERKERELREAKERDKRVAEHSRGINQQRQAEKKASFQSKEIEKKRWDEPQTSAQIQKESSIDEEERGRRSDQMRKERNAEAAQLASQGAGSARNFFKQKSMERPESQPQRGPPPPRKLQHNFGSPAAPAAEALPPKQPIQLPKEETPRAPSPPRHEPSIPESPVHEEAPPPPKPTRHTEPEPEPAPPAPAQVEAPAPVTSPVTRDLLRQGLPHRQQDSDQEDNDDWDDSPTQEQPTSQVNGVSSYQEPQSEPEPQSYDQNQSNEQQYDQQDQYNGQEEQYNHQQEQQSYEQSNNVEDAAEAKGLRARALWDYQAADDTEISFDPDDIIHDIVQIDEGWWQGFNSRGDYGMFPANFVELIEE